jgi:hypothetical protein
METTTFTIINSTGLEMDICHEPECFEFQLPKNEEVMIQVPSRKETVALRVSIENGKVYICVIDDYNFYKVFHNGVDVFEEFMD